MMQENNAVLVVGGYGSVGVHTCNYLKQLGLGPIRIAGRNIQKAGALAEKLGDSASAVSLDLSKPLTFADALDGVKVAVACLEHRNNPLFAKTCFERGISYLEIPGLYDLQCAIEAHSDIAKENGATGVLSVGITPGISNLLVKDCVQKLAEVDSSDLFVVFPMGNTPGEEPGDNGLEWVVSSLTKRFKVYENGVQREVEPFGECKQTNLGDMGWKTGYRFDFSDQHSVQKVLNLKGSSFWMVFDTGAGERMAAAKGENLFPLFGQSEEGVGVFAGLMTVETGGNHVIAQAEVSGIDKDGKPVRLISWVGFDGMNSRTALVAAVTIKMIIEGSGPKGVFHIEEYIENPAKFIAKCNEYGAGFEYHAPAER